MEPMSFWVRAKLVVHLNCELINEKNMFIGKTRTFPFWRQTPHTKNATFMFFIFLGIGLSQMNYSSTATWRFRRSPVKNGPDCIKSICSIHLGSGICVYLWHEKLHQRCHCPATTTGFCSFWEPLERRWTWFRVGESMPCLLIQKFSELLKSFKGPPIFFRSWILICSVINHLIQEYHFCPRDQ